MLPQERDAGMSLNRAFPVMMDFESLRRQESALILLNCFAIATLMLVHEAFRSISAPSAFTLVLALFALRLVEQVCELVWLRRKGTPLSPGQVWVYARLSVGINILFAGLVSVTANSVDAHYSVLLILPLIAAGFRLSLPGVVLVAMVASGLAILEVWVFFWRNPPFVTEEFFEAATMGPVYAVVGLVVWILARYMRRDADALKATIAELERTRDRLVEEEKMAAVGKLASAVAHEIRNPVGMIASALDTALREETTPELRREFAGIAAREASRLEKVTTDFLAYARTKKPDKSPTSVRTTLDYVTDLMKARLSEGGPRIDVVLADDFDAAIDAFQIHQVLLNLLINATQHVESSGTVTLGARRNGGGAIFFVENSGPPVPPKDVADIFDPFFTTRGAGTGLGLAISRNIARAHGGDLVLSVNEPGRVRFSIEIPAE